ISQRNILLQERRWRSAGDITNLASAFVENLVTVAGDASIDHFEPNQRFLHALRFRLFEGGAADKVGLLHLAETIQSGLPHIDRVRDFVSVERQTTFKPQRVARTQAAWDSAKFFSHFFYSVPIPFARVFILVNVNLESVFCRITRASHQDILQTAYRP